ncbi:hypothetical protein [Pyrinomonas sp.]|uniref:hypothetical protein n=1 Tax=Pyrinomonas sp. TaxID=2080306 RepID=UPI003326E350
MKPWLRLMLLVLWTLAVVACHPISGKEDAGIVIARRAQIRSSTAVVAADLLAVERGAKLDILDETAAENGERWYRVRAYDVDRTEGWIEARNVLLEKMLEQSKKLAEEDRNTPAQATGQLRAASNLRLTPDRTSSENVLMRLESGARFEIVGWKRVPKPRADTVDLDDAPKGSNARGRTASEEPKAPAEEYELWYKVRLDPSVSPAPAGWVYGKQVELAVPSDIIFYRTGREFVAWQRLDDDTEQRGAKGSDDARPGSWVILEKSSAGGPPKPNDPDFDRIFVLGYDPEKQEHYIAYRSGNVRGRLPLRVEGSGREKFIVVRLEDAKGQATEARYRVRRDERGILRVEPPSQVKR